MRRLAAGVSLITTAQHDHWYGFTATSVSSVSADPPTLVFCVNRSVSGHDAFIGSGRFAVNLLDHSAKGLAQIFGSSAHRDERFTQDRWRIGETGAPVLRDALATFECRTTRTVPIHSHSLVIGEIMNVVLPGGEMNDPLLYFEGNYHNVGSLILG